MKDLGQHTKNPKQPTKPGTRLVPSSTNRAAAADTAPRAQVPTIQAVAVFNPAHLNDKLTITPNKDEIVKWFDGDLSPPLDEIVASTIVVGPSRDQILSIKPSTSPILGVVYRDPLPAIVRVCSGSGKANNSPQCDASVPSSGLVPSQIIASQAVGIPQLGPYVVMPLKNTAFDNNNLAIAFAANGVPCAIAYATQSQMYQISTILNSTSGAASGGNPASASGSKGSSSSGAASSSSGRGGGSASGGGGHADSSDPSPSANNNLGAPTVACSSQ